MTEKKRSYQTMEFWVGILVTILVALQASDVVPVGSGIEKTIAMVVEIAAMMGIYGFRTAQKGIDAKAEVLSAKDPTQP